MNAPDRISDFIQLLTRHQSRLYAYILSLVGDPSRAEDILQETNLVLWRKANEYSTGTNFAAWALKVSYYQVLAHRQRLARQFVTFDTEALENLAADGARQQEGFESRWRLLRQCLEKLPDRQRNLLRRRYGGGTTLDSIAEEAGLTANAVKQALFRARMNLIVCVRRASAGGE